MVIKQRSPNYPGVDLPTAIQHVRDLYSKVKGGEFTILDAAQNWNLSAGSGGVRRRMGALRQYGLIEQRKGDTAKLTSRSLTLVLRHQASNEFKEAVQEAILTPDLFKELYETGKYQSADDALKQHLVIEKRFSDEGASRFIEVMKESFNYVGLGSEETFESYNEGVTEKYNQDLPINSPTNSDKVRFSISGGPALFNLDLPLPLTEEMWNSLIDMINTLKPMLVQPAGFGMIPESKQLDFDLDEFEEVDEE